MAQARFARSTRALKFDAEKYPTNNATEKTRTEASGSGKKQ
jgi:hypothetical protein